MIGSLQNARVGVALHPQAGAQAGGMTYRPQVPSTAAPVAAPEDAGAATPTAPASFCPCSNKRGMPCGSDPLPLTGICKEHSKKVAQAILVPFA